MMDKRNNQEEEYVQVGGVRINGKIPTRIIAIGGSVGAVLLSGIVAKGINSKIKDMEPSDFKEVTTNIVAFFKKAV